MESETYTKDRNAYDPNTLFRARLIGFVLDLMDQCEDDNITGSDRTLHVTEAIDEFLADS